MRAIRRPQFETGEMYHLCNRGVEQRTVFLDQKDYFRFIHDLYEFNDEESAVNIYYKKKAIHSANFYEVEPRKREVLVDILAFCLMPDHFHILVKQKKEHGVVRFMQKIGTGYTMYFNQRRKRIGPLFQGRFRAVLIEKDAHFLYLPHYIHLNPLDLVMPSWRQGKVEHLGRALNHLASYRWSSYLDLTEQKENFPSVIAKQNFFELYGKSNEYRHSLEEWLKSMDRAGLAGATFE